MKKVLKVYGDPKILNTHLRNTRLSHRTYSALRRVNILTIKDLVQRTEAEMLRIRNFGRSSLFEVKEILGGLGLQFGMLFDTDGQAILRHLSINISDSISLQESVISSLNSTTSESSPPKNAEYLLYLLLPKSERDYIPGDLIEEYNTIIQPKFGKRRAMLWYWKQVISSIGPILWSRLKRLSVFVGIVRGS